MGTRSQSDYRNWVMHKYCAAFLNDGDTFELVDLFVYMNSYVTDEGVKSKLSCITLQQLRSLLKKDKAFVRVNAQIWKFKGD